MDVKKRSVPRQPRALATRDGLLDAARRVLARDGVRAMSTTAIAAEAHVSAGTVYRYFDGRTQILGLLFDRAIQDISAEIALSVARALDTDLEQAMVIVVDTLAAAMEAQAPVLRAWATPGGVDADLMLSVERQLATLSRVLPARFRPELPPDQMDELAWLTMGVTETACLRIALLRPPTADRDRLVRITAQMLARALTPTAAP